MQPDVIPQPTGAQSAAWSRAAVTNPVVQSIAGDAVVSAGQVLPWADPGTLSGVVVRIRFSHPINIDADIPAQQYGAQVPGGPERFVRYQEHAHVDNVSFVDVFVTTSGQVVEILPDADPNARDTQIQVVGNPSLPNPNHD